MNTLQPGLSATLETTVSKAMQADEVGSGSLPVLATPALAALLEQAAVAALADNLATGETSVGTHLSFDHLAATPPGMVVSASATLQAVDRRKLVFEISARDGVEVIAQGTHTRFVVNSERFLQKVSAKS